MKQDRGWIACQTPFGWIGARAHAGRITEVKLGYRGKTALLRALGRQGRVGMQYSAPRTQQVLKQFARALTRYCSGERESFALAIALPTVRPFTRAVYQEMQRIPFGAILSYGEIARAIGSPRAARAVRSHLGRWLPPRPAARQ